MYSRSATNNIESVCSSCKQVNNIGDLLDNVEKVMNKVNGITGTYKLTNTKTTFSFNFNIVTKEKRENWDLSASGSYDNTKVDLYLKDKKFYIVYPNNGAKVILKDNLSTMVKEIELSLDALNATYEKDKLESNILGDKLAGFEFAKLKESSTYVLQENGGYKVTFIKGDVEWNYYITSNFLINKVTSSADNFTSELALEYPKSVSIEYPNGLDFLTLDAQDAKKLLEVDNFAYIIDPDLKSKGN